MCQITFSDGQICVNNPDVNQRGDVFIRSGRQVIVPKATFNCSGRITNIAVSMRCWPFGSNIPLFQVWHPISLNSTTYNKIGDVQLPAGNRIGRRSYNYANLSLNNSN